MSFIQRRCVLIVAVFLSASAGANGEDEFSVGRLRAGPGEAVSGFLDVDARADAGTRIPISILRGTHPGPVLALIAGTHGYEYPGITALRELRQSLRPADLTGTVVLVHIANPPSFWGRTVYTSPVDGKNLNRAYPGAADGSLTERIAHAITTQVIAQSDYLLDLHAGDGNEALRPYVYMPVTGDGRLDSASRGLALAFGLDHIVIDRFTMPSPDATVYTDRTALARGIPAITTETGQLGSNDGEWVDLAVRGCENVMRHLGMLPGPVQPNEGVVWLTDYQIVRSPARGVFRAAVRDGYAVAENGLLGVLMDPFGEKIAELRAPHAGVVNYVLGTPPVSEGEPVAMVSRIASREDMRATGGQSN